jgi:hypothetical protein
MELHYFFTRAVKAKAGDSIFESSKLLRFFQLDPAFMRLPVTLIAGSALALALSGCAGGYRAIQPAQIRTYQNHGTDGSAVEFGYQYSALQLKGGNHKYIKKERKRGYQTIAVRIKNNTAAELNFSRDLELYFGERPPCRPPTTSSRAW